MMKKNMMLREPFVTLFFMALATALIEGCATQSFEPTTERWTIKIRGGRDEAESIARKRGFEVYHEFKELPGIFTLQKVSRPSENETLEDVTISRNFLKDQSEATWKAKEVHISLQPKIFKLIKRTTKSIRHFFSRMRKRFHI